MTTDELIRLKRVRHLVASGAAQAIRVRAGLGVTETARTAQLPARSLRRWEAGERVPTGPSALRYLAVLESLIADDAR